MSRSDVDVAIVGNGAIACALALRLSESQPDARVAIIGPARRLGSASLAAGAMLSAFGELEAGSLAFPFARKKLEAARDASRMWSAHLDLLNRHLRAVPPVMITQGTYVAASRAIDDADERTLDAIAGYLRELGEPFHEADPSSIAGISPREAHRPSRVLYLENEGTVSAKHLHLAYDEAFARLPNLTVVDDEVTSLDPSPTARAVQTRSGATVHARHVVLAAGAFTQGFVDAIGLARRIPRIAFGAGVSLVLKTSSAVPDKVFRSPNRGLASGIYCVPYEAGYCYVGATSLLSPSLPSPASIASAERVRELVSAASDQVNVALAGAEVHKAMVGYRPTTMDTFPLFGETSIEGVWLASGTRRDGFHLSPKAASELATAIDGGKQPFAGAFVPERPLRLEVPKQVAVARAVALLAAAERRAGALLSAEPELRARVDQAYARSGLAAHDFGIPAELLALYASGFADGNIETTLASAASARVKQP